MKPRHLTGLNRRKWFLFFHQFLEKTVQLFVQAFHQFTADDDGVTIGDEQFCDAFFLVILQDKTEGPEQTVFFYHTTVALEHLTADGGHVIVEFIILAVNPFLYDTTGDLIVVIVIDE